MPDTVALEFCLTVRQKRRENFISVSTNKRNYFVRTDALHTYSVNEVLR